MAASAAIAPPLLERARADQVATLYSSWHRTTASMTLGAFLLCVVLWDQESAAVIGVWFAAILANQAWRGMLARAYRRAAPPMRDACRWGNRWALGSTIAGALWGVAAIVMFPASPPYQALLIVCVFSVILGGLNLTAVYKPSFYGFALAALVPLIARVALEGGSVHLFTAIVLFVVLVFVLAFGRRVNDLLTHSLAIRYENVDLIGELTAQTRAAESARSAAETANRAKSQFLAAASHDLRQPLHAMGLFAAALAAKARDPEVKPLVASIHASVDALETLFAQLLDLSRLEAGALHPEPAEVPLDMLFDRLAVDFAPQAAAHGLGLRVVPTAVIVESDPLLLERILRNLVANALRYTRSGGVVLGVRRLHGAARIDVVDTGVGIAAADRSRIFDEFVQVAQMPRHAAGRGMGLGLAIVRRLCTLLGHPLEVASTPGRGSRFSVTMPRMIPRRRRVDPVVAQLSGPLPMGSTTSFRGRRIVVVDDDPAVVSAMHALFTSWGADVRGGEDAFAALAALGTRSADLIVADLRLGDGASGIDAIGRLRDALGTATPALVVSGDTSEVARNEARVAGVTLLSKPVVAAALRNAAEVALATTAVPHVVSRTAEIPGDL